MAKDIPGFYFDAEKNRYFPIKGPIPGSSHPPNPLPPKPTKAIHSRREARVTTSSLLQDRQLNGNLISSNAGNFNFEEEFRKTQASRPNVWRYSETEKLVDSVLQRIRVNMLTPEGETEADVLLTAGCGSLSVFEVGKAERRSSFTRQSVSECVWPVVDGVKNECKFTPETIWRDPGTSMHVLSSVSSIKTCTSGIDDDENIRYVLVTTLGSEGESGSARIFDLAKPSTEIYPTFLLTRPLRQRVRNWNCTIWTADCGANNKAALGTNKGAALLDIVRNDNSWVFKSQSDVLAVQFVQSGNVILCGLRNGAIVTVDIREQQRSSPSLKSLTKHKILYPSSYNQAAKSRKRWFEVFGNVLPSHKVNLPSSITSMVSLQFDDQYFLASSMDGSIRLYDHRLTGKGSVQSYEGNVNSHTRIQLGVDPSEKFVMSGGEDSCLRIWSIKSGELLFQDKFSDTVLSSVCWRGELKTKRPLELLSETNERETATAREYFDEESCRGAWLGSQEGLFYVQF